MALGDVIKNAVASVKTTLNTGKMLPRVTVETLGTQNKHGEQATASSKTYDALVEDIDVIIRRTDGREVLVSSRITFLETVAITDDSKIIIDGRTAPIERIDRGVLDKDGAAIVTQVYLGRLVARA